MLLSTLQCTGQLPWQRIILPKMAIVPRLRSPVLYPTFEQPTRMDFKISHQCTKEGSRPSLGNILTFLKSFFYHQFLLSYPLSYLQRHERWYTSVPLISKKEARELIRVFNAQWGKEKGRVSEKDTENEEWQPRVSLQREKCSVTLTDLLWPWRWCILAPF